MANQATENAMEYTIMNTIESTAEITAESPAEITVELVDGTKVIVPDSLELITPYVLQEQGDWFEDEIKFLRRLVQPGNTVVDIGANYGVYALSLARKVAANGQVWAFEPASDTATLLRRSAAANSTPWLHVLRQALSDREGTAWLQMPGQAELNSLADSLADGAAAPTGPGEAVEVTTLDHCLEAHGWKAVDLLKIDAEGEEERILKGGERFFRELSPLVMFEVKEITELHLHLVQRFAELGYQCFRLVPGLEALVPFSAEQPVDGYLLNLFAAKPERVASLAAGGWLAEQVRAVAPEAHLADQPAGLEPLEGLPYARRWLPRWQAAAQRAEQAPIRRALGAWAQSRHPHAPAAARAGALAHSLALLLQACGPGCNPGRWATLARVAWASGERTLAVRALNTLVQELQGGRSVDPEEPFLSPDPAFEPVEPTGPLEAWLEAAGLSALEQVSSFSSFYTAAGALARLERVQSLGYSDGAMQRRIALLNRRFGRQERQADSSDSVRSWFAFIGLREPLRCLAGGASALEGVGEPWVRWAEEGCAEVLAFEPLETEWHQRHQQALTSGAAIRVLPWALGDGEEHILQITTAAKTASLFPPARSTVALFSQLGELMQVDRQLPVQTHRLDAIAQARGADVLRLAVQGAELMVLEHAQEVLRSVSVIQCRVGFVELHEGQPLMAEVDRYLRSQGFCFLRFASTQGRPFKPLQSAGNPSNASSQMLWGDAVYVRDLRQLERWSDRQLQAAAFLLHEVHEACDLTALLLHELDRRQSTDLANFYLAAVMLHRQDLEVSGDWPAPQASGAAETPAP